MSVTARTLQASADLRRYAAGVTDAQAREIVAGYARAWDEIAGEVQDALDALMAEARNGRVSLTAMRRSDRMRAALAAIADRLTDLADTANVRVVGDLQAIVAQSAEAQRLIVGSQTPPGYVALPWVPAETAALEAIVARSTTGIVSRFRPLPAEQLAVVRRELVRGVAVGDNPRETARRITARTQGRFEGGAARALTIARTETLDALRQGAAAAHEANREVLRGWVWLAELDTRTCPSCLGMHGTVHPLSESGPDDHPNGRCARIPELIPWSELGIPGPEPESEIPSAQDYLDGLSDSERRAQLGGPLDAAYRDGRIGLPGMATRVENADWRASYTTTRV